MERPRKTSRGGPRRDVCAIRSMHSEVGAISGSDKIRGRRRAGKNVRLSKFPAAGRAIRLELAIASSPLRLLAESGPVRWRANQALRMFLDPAAGKASFWH